MDEFEIIRRFFTPDKETDSVIVGVGDDGAVLRPDPGRDLVSVLDTLVEGVHFPPTTHAGDIAYRAVAANVSDIAAMGARPRWMTMGLTLRTPEIGWLEEFSQGLAEALSAFSVDLVGGDMTHGSEVVLSVQIIGDVEQERALTRADAKPGDQIYVSGTIGDAGAGLSMLQKIDQGADREEWMDDLIGRFLRPSARVALGTAIADFASAAIDISDGLYSDLAKLLAASGVGGVIELDDLPLSDALASNFSAEDALRFALGGGEDFELCFTTASDLGDAADIAGVGVTRIGTVRTVPGLSCTRSGSAYDYHDEGYRHFL